MSGASPSADSAPVAPSRRIVLATGNSGKAREISALLGPGWDVVLQSDYGVTAIEETGASFRENAELKARHAALMTGLPALADDSGLEVDALGGAPGVRSARYAGEGASDAQNVRRLLAELEGVADGQRGARFRCVLVWVRDANDARPLVAQGAWEGRICRTPRGINGFGYDPIFEDPVLGQTAAELAPAAKNECSHRGRALQVLRELLASSG